MHDVTQILSEIEQGDPHAVEKLLPLVYEELRRLAAVRLNREAPDQTLQATALVHEAYLRLVDVNSAQDWNSRGHFFGAAAEAMRRILIDRARNKKRVRRGGDRKRVDIDSIAVAVETAGDDLLVIDEALELLSSQYAECASLVRLRFFAGLTQAEAAEALGIPRRSADRHWAFARAWLQRRLDHGESADAT